MKQLKILCIILSLTIVFCAFAPNATAVENTAENASASALSVENEKFILTAEKSGAVNLTVKSSGKVWYSNPADRDAQTQVKGINKMKMNSQLVVTYLADGENEKLSTSFASSTNKNGVTIKIEKNAIKIEYCFKSEEFTIPVRYSLNEKGMKAEILTTEIEEKANLITKIDLLPYWGAGSATEEGYFLVPDGSGAIINFNNGKSTSNYQQDIYSTDGLMNVTSNVVNTDKAYMAVFGIKKQEQSALAIIEDSASVCRMYSFVSGSNIAYNCIYPQFTYRKSSVVQMLSKTWYPLDVTFVSKKKISDENFSVLYIPLANDNGTYSDMACEYREYLKETENFKVKTQGDSVPIYLDVYGSVLVTKNILGFPITVNKELTTCDELKEIIDNLNQNGIKDINIRYKGISKDGLYNKKVPTKLNVASSIGGKKGLLELMEYADNHDVNIYPEEDFVFFKKPSFSLFKPDNVAQDVCQKNGQFYEYDISTGISVSNGLTRYVLKPQNVVKSAEKFLKSYKKAGLSKISVSTLGNMLYSDFSSDICLANKTMQKFEGILNSFKAEDISLMLDAPYIYAAKFADAIIGVPTESSNFDIEDETVPFYQIVLHGLVSYSTPAINTAADSKYALLKAIETGSSLTYSLGGFDYSEIINDDYEELSAISADDWLEEIAEYGKIVSKALETVSEREILAHSKIAENVYKTDYSGDISILVNYGDNSFELDGVTVNGMDFCVLRGE